MGVILKESYNRRFFVISHVTKCAMLSAFLSEYKNVGFVGGATNPQI